jgi:PEGA domain
MLNRLVALLLCSTVLVYADGNTFRRIRYNGGSVASSVSPKDWDNNLTVTPDLIILDLKDKNRVEIPAKSVTSLSYGQEAHRRVGTMIALAVLVSPVALFGLIHKTRLHFIGIQYKGANGNTGGILLQGDKDNYRAVILALQGVTGAPLSVGQKEHEFVPVGVATNVTKGPEENNATAQPVAAIPEPVATQEAVTTTGAGTGTVIVETTPAGADIYVDDQFFGNGPATLKLRAGKHTIRVGMEGYTNWSRVLSSEVGSEAHLAANLTQAPASTATGRQMNEVTVLSQPAGAHIWIDSIPVGRTPTVVKLPAGTYNLTIAVGGYRAYTQQITVETGQVRSFGVALEPAR